jgi:uncharacterized membrane protein
MTRLYQFVKTTLIGGALFLAPLVVIVYLAAKAVGAISKLIVPITNMLPSTMFGMAMADIAAVLILVGAAFGAGVIARTEIGRRFGEEAEGWILRWMPGYTLFKSMSQEQVGASTAAIQVVLATLDDAWLLAFVMEQHPSGMLTVFVPSAPTPTSGTIYFMTEAQVRRIDVPVASVMRSLQQLGVGSASLLANITWPN